MSEKLIVISYNGNGESSTSYAYTQYPGLLIFSMSEKREGFIRLRKELKNTFKNFLKANIRCTNEYRFYLNVIVCDLSDDSKSKKHFFTIDPKNMK